MIKRDTLLKEKPLYERPEAKENEIALSLDELVPGAKNKIEEFNEKCLENSSKFYDNFTRGLCHGDLNWKNILKDQGDRIWIIDFPDAEVKFALHDLAKAISCTMFELTDAPEVDGESLGEYMAISEAIANATSLADDLPDLRLSPNSEPTWEAVRTLWSCCKFYCKEANYSTTQLLMPLLAFAIKTQCWIQYTCTQRKWALQSALLYIDALDTPRKAVKSLAEQEGNGGQQNGIAAKENLEDMQLTATKYADHIKHTCGCTVDPITQERNDILESFVPLNVLQSDEIKKLLAQNIDLDKQAQRIMLNARTNRARGACVEDLKDYSAADAIKLLMPSNAGDVADSSTQCHSGRVLCCLLG